MYDRVDANIVNELNHIIGEGSMLLQGEGCDLPSGAGIAAARQVCG